MSPPPYGPLPGGFDEIVFCPARIAKWIGRSESNRLQFVTKFGLFQLDRKKSGSFGPGRSRLDEQSLSEQFEHQPVHIFADSGMGNIGESLAQD